MKNENNFRAWVLAFCLLPSAFCLGQTNTNVASVLTATVYPGYQFGPTEPPNASKLNRLGLPTVRITGSIDGSSLSAGGVSFDNLASNVFDGLTIVGGHNSGVASVRVNYDTNTLGLNNYQATNVTPLYFLGVKSNSVGPVQIRSNSITAAQVASNALTLYQLTTNFLDAVPLATNAAVNVTTNVLSTNTFVLLYTSANVDTNGVPTNTTPQGMTLANLQAALNITRQPVAYCRFDGTNVTNETLFAKYNITNVTRTAAGSYTCTFSNALPDANYVVVLTAGARYSDGDYQNVGLAGVTPSNFTIVCKVVGQIAADARNINATVFRY